MEALDLLRELRGCGVTVRANGNKLEVMPASRLSDAQRERIRQLKPELLNAVTRPTPPMPALRDWGPMNRLSGLFGKQVRIGDCTFQLWGLTPRRAVCWDGYNLRSFELSDVVTTGGRPPD